MNDIQLLERKLQREIKARKAAESILEKKALQLFESKKKLEELNEQLNQQIQVKQYEIDSKELQYQSLFEKAQHIIFNIDEEGKFLLMNSAAKSIFEINDKTEDHHISDFLENNTSFKELLKTSAGQEVNKEIHLKLKSGVCLEINYQVTEEKKSKIFSIIGQDVTKELALEKDLSKTIKLLEQSEFKNRTILANMKLGILEVNKEGIIRDANLAFCEITGYTRDELLDSDPVEMFLSEESAAIILEKNKEREQGVYSVYELPVKHKLGHTVELLISGAPVQDSDGQIIGSVGIHYDISYQKDLQREVVAAKNLAEAKRKREKAFMNTISHEIKNPLNAIVGMTKLMQDADLYEPYDQYLKLIDSASNNLLALISDYLHISIGDKQENVLHKRKFALSNLLEKIIKDLKIQHQEKEAKIELIDNVDSRAEIYSDPNLLEKIIANLAAQLCKMTTEGVVSIKSNVFEEYGTRYLKMILQSEQLILTPAEQEQLFEITNTNSAEIEVNEENLNLAMSQHLIKSLDTEILLDSKEGRGTSFSFILDIDEDLVTKKSDTNQEPLRQVDFKTISALVIEDNLVNQKYIAAILDKKEIAFDVALNGEIGYSMGDTKAYDIIFMDLHMPVMDGFTSCKKIKSTSVLNKDTPIIALTASNVDAEKKKALDAGMLDFVTKPFLPKDIYELIAKHTNAKSSNPKELAPDNLSNEYNFDGNLNTEVLHKYFAGDLVYVKDMFDIFCQEMPNELNTIIKLETITEVNRFAHKIKPSYEMVGLSELSRALYKIEMISDASAITSIREIEKDLREGLQIIVAENNKLEDWLNKK